jgi:hypothetical protein
VLVWEGRGLKATVPWPLPQQHFNNGTARRFCRAGAAQGRTGAAKTLNLNPDLKSSLYRAGQLKADHALPRWKFRIFVEMTI